MHTFVLLATNISSEVVAILWWAQCLQVLSFFYENMFVTIVVQVIVASSTANHAAKILAIKIHVYC